MKTYFHFQSLQSYFSSLWSSVPWTGFGNNCWFRNLCSIPPGPQSWGQQTPRNDSPEGQGPVHFVSLPLTHRGTLKCWVSEQIPWAASSTGFLELELVHAWQLRALPFRLFSVGDHTVLFTIFSEVPKLGYGSQSPKWPPEVPSSHILMRSPLTLCDQKHPAEVMKYHFRGWVTKNTVTSVSLSHLLNLAAISCAHSGNWWRGPRPSCWQPGEWAMVEAARPNLLSTDSQVTSLFSIPTFPSLCWKSACEHTTGPLSSAHRKPDTIFYKPAPSRHLYLLIWSGSPSGTQSGQLSIPQSLSPTCPTSRQSPGPAQVLLSQCLFYCALLSIFTATMPQLRATLPLFW